MYKLINAIKWKKNMYKTALWYRLWLGEIGTRCTICKPLRLEGLSHIYLGNHVRFREGARIEAIDRYDDQMLHPKLVIGDDTGFEQGLHLTCGAEMNIGKNVTVLAYVMITDIYHEYEDIQLNVLNQKIGIEKVNIGDNCFIGMGARIMPGTILGKNCVVGANAVVSGVYMDYCVIVGAPSYIVKRYDEKKRAWRKTDRKGKFCDE